DKDKLIEQVQGDPALLRTMIRLFKANGEKSISEIHTAVTELNSKTLQTSAHKLEGWVAIFGTSPLLELARALETCGSNQDVPAARQAEQKLDAAFRELTVDL